MAPPTAGPLPTRPPTLGLQQTPRAEQCQLALPALLQLLGLLVVPRGQLEDQVREALDRNPCLDQAPGGPCVACGRHTSRTVCGRCRAGERAARPDRAGAGHSVQTPAAEDPLDVVARAARLELPGPLRRLVAVVIGSLDERGLCPGGPERLAADLGLPPAAVRAVVDALARAGPPGLAAPDPLACLGAQAHHLVATGQAPPLLADLVERHLEAVAAEDWPGIAAAAGATLDAVTGAARLLRDRLRPWVMWEVDPASDAGKQPGAGPPPDVLFDRDPSHPHGLRAEVPGARWYGLRLAPLGRGGPEARGWSAPWEREARHLLRQIDARAGALATVADALIETQHDFLQGRAPVPAGLTRTRVASATGLSLSTVSRVVQDKVARLPDGAVIPLSALFDVSAPGRHAVGEILRHEPGLSDAGVSARLAEAGHRVARRTVAKYRSQLGIPANRPSAAEDVFA